MSETLNPTNFMIEPFLREKVIFIPLFTQKEKSFIIVFAADARQCMPPNPARTGM